MRFSSFRVWDCEAICLTTDLFEITFGLKLRRAEQPTCKCEVVSPVRGQKLDAKAPSRTEARNRSTLLSCKHRAHTLIIAWESYLLDTENFRVGGSLSDEIDPLFFSGYLGQAV